jgi:pyruvate dehydrogenase E2 component (dihydrolipoamide acetyltransferase)
MGEFHMPSLGADMEHGTIIEWRVKPGDVVRRGDIVAVVDTEKSDIEIEVFESGIVGEIRVPVGLEVPVGAVLATITSATNPAGPAAGAPTIPATPTTPTPPTVPATPTVPAPPTPTVAARAGSVPPRTGRSSPYARRLAAAVGLDIDEIAALYPDRPVVAADVESYVAGARSTVVPGLRPTTSETRASTRSKPPRASGLGAVGRLMERSKREIPHYYLTEDLDLNPALEWMEARNERAGVHERLLPAALLLRAVVLALDEVPALNAHDVDGEITTYEHVHLAIAVSQRGGGLVAPVISEADTLDIDGLMAAMLTVVGRARSGTLRASDVATATITVTNLGDQGALAVWGVIVPPQVAIVGFGRIAERPWVVDGMLTIRRVVTATLSADHRVTHGHVGARFLRAVARLLENPEELA